MRNREMHCHSNRSDGKNTLAEVLTEAQRLNLDFLALTNHDVIAPQEFQQSLQQNGIQTCDSVEISARNYDLEKSLHLVSYAKIFHDSLHEILGVAQAGKDEMKRAQFEKLTSELGFSGTKQNFDIFMRETLGRAPETSNKYDMTRYFWSISENQNLMKSLLGELAVSDDIVVHFYEECLKRGGKLYHLYGKDVMEYEPSVEQAVEEVVKKSGGIISLAHPNVTFSENKGGITEFKRTIADYVEKGINAIEINTMASYEWVQVILEARRKYNLILTFGSDCHQIGYDGRDGKHATIGKLNPYIHSLDFHKRFHRGSGITDDNFAHFQETVGLISK